LFRPNLPYRKVRQLALFPEGQGSATDDLGDCICHE